MEARWRERLARWPADPSWRSLTVERLRAVAECEGIDFATALLYDRLVSSAEHGPFIRGIDGQSPPRRLDATVAVVPGACYVEYPHTGADGRRLCETAHGLGCRVETVPIRSFAAPADNARILLDWLDGHAGDPLVLVSLSKGGADVWTALGLPGAEAAFRRVTAWVNLSGIVWGTPLAGWYAARRFRRLGVRLLCWCHGWDFTAFCGLDRRADGPLAADWRLPDWLPVIHVLGFPLREHLSSRAARRSHRRLAPQGSNDGGGILLGDVVRLHGLVYPVWGADHYMQPAQDVRPLIGKLLRHARDAAAVPVP